MILSPEAEVIIQDDIIISTGQSAPTRFHALGRVPGLITRRFPRPFSPQQLPNRFGFLCPHHFNRRAVVSNTNRNAYEGREIG